MFEHLVAHDMCEHGELRQKYSDVSYTLEIVL